MISRPVSSISTFPVEVPQKIKCCRSSERVAYLMLNWREEDLKIFHTVVSFHPELTTYHIKKRKKWLVLITQQ